MKLDALADRILEYTRALGLPWTYALHRNPYALAGLCWGLPIPVVSVLVVQWATGTPVTLSACLARFLSHGIFIVLALHPLIFAVLFGAFGTVREQQARRIDGLIRQLESLAATDGLTGLLNQREFDRCLRELREPYALALVDLDFLKRVNDTHGHAQGDLALCHLAGLLKRNARSNDLVGRTGGDEFGLLLPGARPEEARQVCERVRAAIAGTPCPMVAGAGSLPLTVSVGLALSGIPVRDPKRVLEEADKALYRAKAEGRDRVCVSA